MLASVRQVLQNTKIDRGMYLSSTIENRTLACGKDLKNEEELYRKRGGNMQPRDQEETLKNKQSDYAIPWLVQQTEPKSMHGIDSMEELLPGGTWFGKR